jgi:pteridine reductase
LTPGLDTLALAGQRALVTGAAKRLGRETALALARAGADVVVHYRNSRAEAEETAAGVRAAGRLAWLVQHSLDNAGDAEQMFQRALDAAGNLDLLINNASAFPAGSMHEVGESEVLDVLQMNALAPFALGRAFAAQGREGCIINLLDSAMLQYDPRRFAYHLSKRLLHTLTMAGALEFAPRVRVNAVAPGAVLAPEGEDQSYLEARGKETPLKRHGDPSMIADAVCYLAAASFVTGQIIYVDGGRHLYGGPYG